VSLNGRDVEDESGVFGVIVIVLIKANFNDFYIFCGFNGTITYCTLARGDIIWPQLFSRLFKI